jgi:integrase
MSKLTVGSCLKYKARKSRYEIWDTLAPGMVLIVQPSGAKGFAYRFRRPNGQAAKLTLGAFVEAAETADAPEIGAPLTLPQARELTYKLARQRARGVDVVAEHIADKSRQRTKSQDLAANTFGAAVREFFVDHKTKKWKTRPRRWREDARLLGLAWPKDADPAVEPTIVKGSLADTWGDRPLASIDAHDCFAVIDESKKRGIPGIKARNGHASDARGRKVHSALSTLFAWALQRRKVTANPVVGLWHPGAPPSRERVLSDDEIKVFWNATDHVTVPFGAVLRLLLLTGCRRNEVNGARWSELADDGSWTIPTSRAKNHRVHVVPLSPLAQDILSKVARVEGDLVFTTNGRTPVSGWSKIKAALDEQMKVPPWRIHDLRRTVATGMAELGILPHIIESTLNHVSGSRAGVAGVYNRSELLPERKAALLRWSQHVEGLIRGDKDKVVTLKRRR